jgi:hypothetical protein
MIKKSVMTNNIKKRGKEKQKYNNITTAKQVNAQFNFHS